MITENAFYVKKYVIQRSKKILFCPFKHIFKPFIGVLIDGKPLCQESALFSGFLLVKVKRYQRVCVIGYLRQNAVPLIDGLILYKLV